MKLPITEPNGHKLQFKVKTFSVNDEPDAKISYGINLREKKESKNRERLGYYKLPYLYSWRIRYCKSLKTIWSGCRIIGVKGV
ncbi:hypothetical protein FF1_002839 [Malus domestica]